MTITSAAGVCAPPGCPRTRRADLPRTDPDLLVTGGELADRLHRAIADGAWLDAFLAAAAFAQLVDDRSHRDLLQLSRAADYLTSQVATPARAAGAAARTTARVVGGIHAHRPGPGRARLAAAAAVLRPLTLELARRVLDASAAERSAASDLRRLTEQACRALPDLGAEPARLPAGLHAFDMEPADVIWLADAFQHDHGPALAGPLCVLGVRTAGSYLAPLHGAALVARGAAQVDTVSYRPGRPLHPDERARLARVARAGGRILLVDDPPVSGRSLADTLTELDRAGIPGAAVVLALSIFEDAPVLPTVLRGHAAVLQPYSAWAVHTRLTESAVTAGLAELLGPGWRVDDVRRVERARQPSAAARVARRGHARARFTVRLARTGEPAGEQREIVVEGAGLGWYAGPAVSAATALADHLPRVYGVRDGLLYRDWLPTPVRSIAARKQLAAVVGGYVCDRAARLDVDRDPTPRLRGRDPVWELVAALLARPLGPLAPAAQLWPLGPLARRLLAVSAPAVTDGATDAGRWLPDPAQGGRLVKVDFYEHAFSHFDHNCYDPVFDLAGAADPPGDPDPELGALLRAEYARRTGRRVDDERWLLYRLLHAWRRRRTGEVDGAATAARAAAAAVHEYLAARYLADLPAADRAAPLCALDLDGVLETDVFGYPAASPTGALALRSLRAHGYRPVLATGRALTDVRDRCVAFGLAGAVAEYGTVVYRHGDRMVFDLRSRPQRELLAEARHLLAQRPGVSVDPAYRFAIRARGPSGPLDRAALVGLPMPGLCLVPGRGQTDVTAVGLDKGAGLRALAARLDAPGVALAVGDSEADLPMLAVAALSRAPANADPAVRRQGIRLTRHGYQAGLAEAVADLLGHRPGGCATCRPPRFARSSRALLAVLAMREGRLSGLATGTLRTADYLYRGSRC